MTFNVDLVGIAFFLLLGYTDDLILPKYYHYENTVVGVYKQYQCPHHCAVDHYHFVYYNSEMTNNFNMCIDKSKLGKKYRPKKNKKKK